MLESERLANHMQDDAFHEIQLNGKQLVFLFMAATVVSVVIFLCGVLVGRGVRAERGGPIADASFSSAQRTGSAASAGNPSNPGNPPNASAGSAGDADSQPPQSPPAASDPTAAAPPPTVDDLTYFNRLEKQKAPREELKPRREEPKPREEQKPLRAETKPSTTTPAAQAPADKPAHAEPRATAPPPVAEERTGGSSEPAGSGFSIQIAALGERTDADSLAKGLSSKGYTAYVLPPASGAPSVFRVRVGKFSSRREAESIAAKLEKEEHFKPWITR